MICMTSHPCQKEVSRLKKHDPRSLEKVFFGSVTVGERGQLVIPAQARKELDIHAGDKLLVMGHPFATGLVLAKIDSMREFLSAFLEGLSGMEKRFDRASLGGAPQRRRRTPAE